MKEALARIDALAAFVLAAASAGVGLGLYGSVAYAIAGVTATATVAVRRRYPITACAVALAAASAGYLVAPPDAGRVGVALVVLAFLLDFYSLGSASVSLDTRIRACTMALVALASLALLAGTDPNGVVDVLASWAYFVGLPFTAGRAIATRSALASALAEQNARMEREQQERIDQVTRSERARIARELHDVVAHSVSVMVIQAAAARNATAANPGRAGEALRIVEECGRAGLTEMRQMVGILRRSELAGAGDPVAGITQVAALVERAGAAGLAVGLTIRGERRPLASGLDLVAYRIVQEALTNSVKHAGPGRAAVGITYGDAALEIEITDSGPAPGFAAAAAPGAGRGLLGLHERVRIYGGEVSAGLSPDSPGFRVRARLPIDPPGFP